LAVLLKDFVDTEKRFDERNEVLPHVISPSTFA
jgi:hypothetical protein